MNQGWANADSDVGAAKAAFKAALDQAPGNVDANYGYGYVLIKSGQPAAAKPYLCVGLKRGDTDTKREAQGFLSRNGLTCD